MDPINPPEITLTSNQLFFMYTWYRFLSLFVDKPANVRLTLLAKMLAPERGSVPSASESLTASSQHSMPLYVAKSARISRSCGGCHVTRNQRSFKAYVTVYRTQFHLKYPRHS